MSSARKGKPVSQAQGLPSIGEPYPKESQRLDKINKMIPVEVDRSEYEAAIGEIGQSDITATGGDSCATIADAGEKSSLVIKLPRGPAPIANGYQQRHVQLQLEANQASALGQLHAALEAKQEKLANGRLVTSRADAMRYLLEQLHAAASETKPAIDETKDGEIETNSPSDATQS